MEKNWVVWQDKRRLKWSTGIKDVHAERQIIVENTNTRGERCLEDLQSAQKPIGRLIPEEIPTGSKQGERTVELLEVQSTWYLGRKRENVNSGCQKNPGGTPARQET